MTCWWALQARDDYIDRSGHRGAFLCFCCAGAVPCTGPVSALEPKLERCLASQEMQPSLISYLQLWQEACQHGFAGLDVMQGLSARRWPAGFGPGWQEQECGATSGHPVWTALLVFQHLLSKLTNAASASTAVFKLHHRCACLQSGPAAIIVHKVKGETFKISWICWNVQ